ncbi:hypothetical protein MHBO_003077 [Bonamia ostreae]|uniref:Uncharacterized protein n=1 Tax=Bonamia ostreae TaxID=126728 RepID=A0ABV2APT6_9EUKA
MKGLVLVKNSDSPGWCDRILYFSERLEPSNYKSVLNIRNSYHRPVSINFDYTIQFFDEKYDRYCDMLRDKIKNNKQVID